LQNLVTLITWLTFIIGVALALGGVYVAMLDQKADTLIEIFGQEINASSAGVPIAFLGVVMVTVTFRHVLKLAKNMLDYEALRPDTAFHHLAVRVYEKGNESRNIGEAEIVVMLPFKEEYARTHNSGVAKIAYPAMQTGKLSSLVSGHQVIR